MALRFFLPAALFIFTGCATVQHKMISFDPHPVCARVKSECIDEDTLRYSVVFRNTGCEVISFDYTIGDKPCVVHIDSEGPNSGLVENLYPGAELEVESPFKCISVFIKIGKCICGKRTSEEIREIFLPSPKDKGGDDGFDSSPLGDSDLPALPTVFP